MTSLTCVCTLYNSTNIITHTCCHNSQSYMCTYPIQQQKHKHLPSSAASMKPFKDHITLLSHVPIGIPYTAPSIVPITLPSQKPISDPTFVPSSNPTTHQSQVPRKKTSEFQYIVSSLEHYDKN